MTPTMTPTPLLVKTSLKWSLLHCGNWNFILKQCIFLWHTSSLETKTKKKQNITGHYHITIHDTSFSQVILFELLFAIILAISSNTCEIRYMCTWLSENDHNSFLHCINLRMTNISQVNRKNDKYLYQDLLMIPLLSCICSELFKM